MTEQIVDDVPETTPEGEATEPVADSKGSEPENDIAIWRKRQAGADAARAVAERKAAELEAQLVKYQQAEREQQDAGLSETAKLQQQLAEAERRAQEAEARAEARILDVKYPNARKELPEVTDEVRLAKFEAMLRDDGEAPTDVRSMRAPRTAASAVPAEQESSKDIFARLKGMGNPFAT